MGVYRNNNGKWMYRTVVKLPDGTKERISGTPMIDTKAAAQEAEEAHIKRLLNPPPVEKEPAPAFSVFARDWLKSYPLAADNRPSTLMEKAQHLEAHLLPFFKNMPLDKIDAEVITRFFAHLGATKAQAGGRRPQTDRPVKMLETTLAPKTIKNIGQTLHKILISAFEWRKIVAVPPWPKRTLAEVPWDFYTREEAEKLLAAARDEEDRLLLMFALKTGARVGEQLALEWGDVDFAGHRVTFRRSLHKGVEGPTKTGRGRTVPLSPVLEALLKAHRHLKGDKVFCDIDGRPYVHHKLWIKLRRTQRRAGLRELRWHDLRHSFASQLVTAGVSLKQVQEWLGHSTIMMTMRYAHLASNENAVKEIAMLDGAEGDGK